MRKWADGRGRVRREEGRSKVSGRDVLGGSGWEASAGQGSSIHDFETRRGPRATCSGRNTMFLRLNKLIVRWWRVESL